MYLIFIYIFQSSLNFAVICKIPNCDDCKKDPDTGKEICEVCDDGYRLDNGKCERKLSEKKLKTFYQIYY